MTLRVGKPAPSSCGRAKRLTSEETLGERRRQMASGVGLTVESADLYEAVVVELEGARV